jgi:hypothetical protein
MNEIRPTKTSNGTTNKRKTQTFTARDVYYLISTLQKEEHWGEIIIKIKGGKIPTILKNESLSPELI